MTPLELILVRGAAQVAVFSLVLVAVYLAARRIGPRPTVSLLLWGLVLVLGLSALAASPWPRWSLERTAEASQPAESSASVQLETQAAPEAESASTGAIQPDRLSLADYSAIFVETLTKPQPVAEASTLGWRAWLGVGVLAMVAGGLLRLLFGLASVRRLRAGSVAVQDASLLESFDETAASLGQQGRVELRESPHVATPATIGWRSPVVLLPSAWSEWTRDQQRAVLAHELAHVAARDFLGWLVARAAVAIHFYNPLVRWLAGRLQLEQELAADATAAALVGDRQGYLKCLASLALATPPHRMTGPARTLIPTRSLLLRRVEMLRSPLSCVTSRSVAGRLRWCAAGLLLLSAAGVAGLRAPQESLAQAPAVQFSQINPAPRIPLELVPEGTVYAISVRPAELLAKESLKPLAKQIDANLQPARDSGVSVAEFAEVCVFVPQGANRPRFVVRMVTPDACDRYLDFLKTQPDMKPTAGQPQIWRDRSEQVVLFDSTTLVIDHYATTENGKTPPLKNPVPLWADDWNQKAESHGLVACDNQALRLAIANEPQLAGGLPLQMIAPLLDRLTNSTAAFSVEESLQLTVKAKAKDEASAVQVADTLKAMMMLGRNVVRNQQQALQEQKEKDRNTTGDVQLDQFLGLAEHFLTETQVRPAGDEVTLTYAGEQSVDDLAKSIAVALPPIQAARTAARRVQSINNLKQLALAMHNYHDTHKMFPRPSNNEYYDYKNSRWMAAQHPYSWRVALLPFLEQRALYDTYRFDQPWDGEANKLVSDTQVPTFRDPSSTADANVASYFLLVGPSTMSPGDKDVRFRDITDGTSRTLMIVEAVRDVPWTKPEDIAVAVEGPLPKFGGHYEGLFLAALCDGSVHTIPTPIDGDLLRSMITCAGREVFDWPPNPTARRR